MLPDLRIVIIAVLSTFVLTAGAGFYASSRMMQESNKRADAFASREETPVNRIALSWPEPTRQPEPLALDFAITAKALRNPVRDVTQETAAAETQPVQAPASAPVADRDVEVAPAAIQQPIARQAEIREPAVRQSEIKPSATNEPSIKTAAVNKTSGQDREEPVAGPAPAISAAPVASAPAATRAQPDIRITVEYPPLLELPVELRTPAPVSAPKALAAAMRQPADRADTTGSVAAAQPAKVAAPTPRSEPDRTAGPTRIASLPNPSNAATVQQDSASAAPAKAARKKAAPKKAAAAKRAKSARRTVARAATVPAISNFPLFFGHSFPN